MEAATKKRVVTDWPPAEGFSAGNGNGCEYNGEYFLALTQEQFTELRSYVPPENGEPVEGEDYKTYDEFTAIPLDAELVFITSIMCETGQAATPAEAFLSLFKQED